MKLPSEGENIVNENLISKVYISEEHGFSLIARRPKWKLHTFLLELEKLKNWKALTASLSRLAAPLNPSYTPIYTHFFHCFSLFLLAGIFNSSWTRLGSELSSSSLLVVIFFILSHSHISAAHKMRYKKIICFASSPHSARELSQKLLEAEWKQPTTSSKHRTSFLRRRDADHSALKLPWCDSLRFGGDHARHIIPIPWSNSRMSFIFRAHLCASILPTSAAATVSDPWKCRTKRQVSDLGSDEYRTYASPSQKHDCLLHFRHFGVFGARASFDDHSWCVRDVVTDRSAAARRHFESDRREGEKKVYENFSF